VQVFDLASRAVLRTFKGHESAVHVAQFTPNKTQVMSCSDDKTVRLWSLEDDRELNCFRGHEDYVRTGLVSVDNPNIVASGKTKYMGLICNWSCVCVCVQVRMITLLSSGMHDLDNAQCHWTMAAPWRRSSCSLAVALCSLPVQ